ncbi:glycosyltransferase [Agrilutibacter solisilvae]|uniref:Glycosyltransferase n=1 Tax=Agrilutibacter solisilvae TaxID=2763317 RepID=A0A975AS43_9GAMM|nr:glycosyltransferase [Lysobacter solisilvae]QSX77679.1 glycosyltransferase [Lysobacter solisilvae]
MRRDRLLIVIDGMEVGGSQRQVQQLLHGLDRRRWEPELLYFRSPSFLVDEIARDGVRVHCIRKRHRVDLPFLWAYARLLRERDYALIHAFSLTAELASVFARALARRRPALVASERSFALDRPRWFWWLKGFAIGRSAAVIANSRAGARATAQRTGMPDARFDVVPNGVALPQVISPDERAALRHELGVAEEQLLALFVGRLVPVKNLPSLIRALAALEPEQRPRVALAGGGPEQDALELLAADLGVDANLVFLGERTDVPRLLQAADYLVLTSHFEGLSNAALEAMAAGCPVIASAVGGTPELVDNGRSGLLFPPDDAPALAAAMARMGDAELRRRLARGATAHVNAHHSGGALAAATSAVYERCLRAKEYAKNTGVAGPEPVQGPAK